MQAIELVSMDSGVTRLIVRGRLHLGSALSDAECTAKSVAESGARKLLIDMSETESIDSAALGMIIVTCARMSEAGGKTVLCGVNPRVRNVFAITHADQFLSIRDTLDSALLALG
jgi:anti-anti-sigma factor